MDARIADTRVQLPFNKFRHEYAWEGSDNSTAFVDYRYLDEDLKAGQSFWLGHLNLIVVDRRPELQRYEVALMGGRGYQSFIRRKFLYAWQNFQARLILTLYVWGLADFYQGERLTWKSVHWGRKSHGR